MGFRAMSASGSKSHIDMFTAARRGGAAGARNRLACKPTLRLGKISHGPRRVREALMTVM